MSLARQEGAHVRALCRRFGIRGCKLLTRHAALGDAGLEDRPRRAKSSPRRTPPEAEALLLSARNAHPARGARRELLCWLEGQGHGGLPSPGAATAVLRRHGQIDPAEPTKHAAWTRLEHPAPNDCGKWTSRAMWRCAGGAPPPWRVPAFVPAPTGVTARCGPRWPMPSGAAAGPATRAGKQSRAYWRWRDVFHAPA
ncbi:MAG: hypothetical protein ACKN9T_09230 [Candidatus Methylumidiphilus sp.]